MAADTSPLLGYLGNAFAIGASVAATPEFLPKRESQLRAPSLVKLFTDNGANWQGASIQVTLQSTFSTTPVTSLAPLSHDLRVDHNSPSARA